MSKRDPIRQEYYRPVERAEAASTCLFILGAVLSVLVLFVDKGTPAYSVSMAVFSVDAIALFALGLAIRLYWSPRATNARTKDFLGHAWQLPLSHKATEGYYNNEHHDPIQRMAAQILENSLFSKRIALKMAILERARVIGYFVLWFLCFFNRATELDVIVAGTQVLFSEQVISKYLRLEWLRSQCESVYDSSYTLLQHPPKKSAFMVMALANFSQYENAKACAAITLSEKVFHQLNPSLSEEWAAIKATVKLS